MIKTTQPALHGVQHLPDGSDPIPGFPYISAGPGAYDTVILAIPDLYGYWRVGEDTGTTFADSSGNGHNLTKTFNSGGGFYTNDHPLTHNVTGALVTYDDGAVEFNIPPGQTAAQGNGEWLEDAATTAGPNGAPITACGWIKTKASALTMADGVAFGTTGLGLDNIGWGICVTWPARTLRLMRHGLVGGVSLDFGSSLLADTWYFVCFTDDGANHRLYVNTVEVDSVAYASVGGTSDRMRIGWGVRSGGSYQWRPFYGMVDEVAVWTRALTIDEIETIYAAGTDTGGLAGGLVWTSNGSGGASWEDPTLWVTY